jgi:epsilon-lactone hydrolase
MTDGVPARGSLRSRAAALVSGLTLRQVSAVLPAEQAWGLWLPRQIVAGIMDAFGPSLGGTRVEPIDAIEPDGHRIVGEWVRAPGLPAKQGAIYFVHGSGYALCSPRTHRRLTSPRLSPEAAKAMAHVARFIDTSMRANGFDAATGKAG